jgi:membrane-associated protease RseP (regulator of RpoE activity)
MPINIGRRKLIALIGSAAVVTAVATPPAAQQRDSRSGLLLSRVLQLQATAAAGTIADFLNEVRGQVGWTVGLPWTLGKVEERRFDGLRLLRQAPAVAQIAMLDPAGKEQLRVSRFTLDEIGQRTDFSQDPRFTEAVAHGVYYGTVRLAEPRPIQRPAERCEADQGNTREIGAIEGLGVFITDENGQIKVQAPIDNTPAAKAGIMAGDIIVALDDQPVQGLTLSQVATKMRGPVNTTIKLTIMRSGRDTPIELSLIRAVIRQSAAVTPCPPASQPAASQPTPFLTLSLAGARRESGVSMAEVNLQQVLDVIHKLQIGEHGVAYVLDAQDRVVAHSDMFRPIFATDGNPLDGDFSLFQRDFSALAQVRAARAGGSGSASKRVPLAHDIDGREVLAASASVAVPGLGWLVLVELPVAEADKAVP